MAALHAASLYDARGNKYFVASPELVRTIAPLPSTPEAAAKSYEAWTGKAVHEICSADKSAARSEGKQFLSDGLLVGPFESSAGFSLLIVNTDGTLAERSGNGLTIFSQYLIDCDLARGKTEFDLIVHHANTLLSETVARCVRSKRSKRNGILVDMGIPTFGPSAVGASAEGFEYSGKYSGKSLTVLGLQKLRSDWIDSVFVNVGNPHCVTFLEAGLPKMSELSRQSTKRALSQIANSSHSKEAAGLGLPCDRGVNLQWAEVSAGKAIRARVFERGEGPTRSSGSSAVAVAAAARYLGLTASDKIDIVMPGGVAPIEFSVQNQAFLFGQATRQI